MGRGLRGGGGAEGDAGGAYESGTGGAKEGGNWAIGAGAAGRAETEGCTESGTESCKEGNKEPMATAAAGRAGAEGCWAGPGGAIVVPAVARGWSAAAAGAVRACGASRVSNNREQSSPGRNAHRAAFGEHRLGLEAS